MDELMGIAGSGRAGAAGRSGSSTAGLRSGLSGRWSGQAAVGGPNVALNSWVQAVCQGHRSGRCRRSLRAEWASRAGTAISWVRMVAVVAFAWKTEARAPVARVRLNAIAASTSQAEFAANFRRAGGPARRP